MLLSVLATAAPAQSPLGMMGQFALPLAFVAIFYFLVIRPQSKRVKEHKAMVEALKVGTEVIFAGGLMGKIKKIEGEYAVIALNNNTDVKIQRASVINVLPAGTLDTL